MAASLLLADLELDLPAGPELRELLRTCQRVHSDLHALASNLLHLRVAVI